MKYRPRIYYTESQKALMWERWRKGESLQQIAQLFDRNHSSVQRILAETGGIQPRPRCRSRRALSLAEREEISRGLVAGHSIRSIAALLRRAPSTISREIKRNGGQPGYRASQAEEAAWDRERRPKPCKLAVNCHLAHLVADKLRRQWSPEQIAGWLKCAYPGSEDCQVSHETIYRTLFIQTWGALKRELLAHLRHTRAMRRSRHHTQKTDNHGRIVDAIPISERPHLGWRLWKKWTGYHRQSRVETTMGCFKLLGDRLAARLPERQAAEVHVRCAILNTFNRLGIPVTVAHA